MAIVNYIKEMWELASNGNLQGLFFFISLYALFTMTYSVIYQLKVRSWPSVKGVMLKDGMDGFDSDHRVRSDHNFYASVLYEFTVEGKEYQGTRVSSWLMVVSYNLRFLLKKQMSSIQRSYDGNVTIFFNPNNPNKSYLIKPGKFGILITFLLATLPFLFYIAIYLV